MELRTVFGNKQSFITLGGFWDLKTHKFIWRNGFWRAIFMDGLRPSFVAFDINL